MRLARRQGQVGEQSLSLAGRQNHYRPGLMPGSEASEERQMHYGHGPSPPATGPHDTNPPDRGRGLACDAPRDGFMTNAPIGLARGAHRTAAAAPGRQAVETGTLMVFVVRLTRD